MKRFILFSFLVCNSILAFAQLRIAVGYNYMMAGGWDRAIQTYNFARPELTDKQSLFIHGVQVESSVHRKSEKTLKHGIMTSYRYFRSAASNNNFDVALNAHLLNVGYMLHSSAVAPNSRLFGDVSFCVVVGGIFRRVNGEPQEDDGRRIWAPGIGGELRPRIGYDLILKDKLIFSPYIQTTYCPFYYSPRAEAVLNQTMTLTGLKYTGILSLEIGICIRRSQNSGGQ